jgi:DNA helicase-2/ATP-dependent DNA helicase PcrA
MNDFETRYCAARRAVIGREFERLNPMQREAVFRTEGPLLLLAGAGSGKTTVLINRVINLLRFGRAYYSGEVPAWIGDPEMETLAQAAAEPQSVPDAEISRLCAVDPPRPWEIIAITFTNKAAGELRDRLTTAWGPRRRRHLGAPPSTPPARASCASTSTGWAIDRSFTIYDDDDQKRLMTDDPQGAAPGREVLPARDVLARSSATPRTSYETPEDYRANEAGATTGAWGADLSRIRSEKLKSSQRRWTFDDIIFHTVTLLRTCDDVRATISASSATCWWTSIRTPTTCSTCSRPCWPAADQTSAWWATTTRASTVPRRDHREHPRV